MLPNHQLYSRGENFSRPVACHFGAMASWAYKPGIGDDEGIRRAIGFDSATRYDYPQLQAGLGMVVCRDSRGFQIAIAGTQELSQWYGYVVQSGILPIAGAQGRTFRAFEVWSAPFMQTLMALLTPNDAVAICGHSLGGALSILIAEKLKAVGVSVNAVYTYGCPRVGDETFMRSVTTVVHNICGESDAVTYSPPSLFTHNVRIPLYRTLWPELFRPGIDYVLHDDNAYLMARFRQSVDWATASINPFTLYDTARYHVLTSYLPRMWERLQDDDRLELRDWFGVARNRWNQTLTPTV